MIALILLTCDKPNSLLRSLGRFFFFVTYQSFHIIFDLNALDILHLLDMLKKFNPQVKGFSTGIIPVLSQEIFKQKSRFNVAVSGAVSKYVL